MEADVLAERILQDLKNTFRKDPLIDEFDVIPVPEAKNKCPVIHVEHKVALEDWCVKHVYSYAYTRFFDWKRNPYKIDTDCLLTWTSAILLINPEIETVWNARKTLMCQNLLKSLEDLRFSKIVLSFKPNSSPTFAHRKWVLSEIMKGAPSPPELDNIIYEERLICLEAARRYPSNYHAWSHRSWILTDLYHVCFRTVSYELHSTMHLAGNHVSDHSVYQYRQFLISCYKSSKLLTSSSCLSCFQSSSLSTNFQDTFSDDCNIFSNTLYLEMSRLCFLQTFYQGHEALWYHRRYLLHELHPWLILNDVSNPTVYNDCKRHKCEHVLKGSWKLSSEEEFLIQRWKSSNKGTWERTLIERHVKWMSNVLSLSVPEFA